MPGIGDPNLNFSGPPYTPPPGSAVAIELSGTSSSALSFTAQITLAPALLISGQPDLAAFTASLPLAVEFGIGRGPPLGDPDIVFHGAYAVPPGGDVRIDFAESAGQPNITVSFGAALYVEAEFSLAPPDALQFAAPIGIAPAFLISGDPTDVSLDAPISLQADFSADWDPNTYRGPSPVVGDLWRETAPAEAPMQIRWSAPAHALSDDLLPWGKGAQQTAAVRATQGEGLPLDARTGPRWREALPMPVCRGAYPFRFGLPLDARLRGRYSLATPRSRAPWAAPWHFALARNRRPFTAPWGLTAARQILRTAPWDGARQTREEWRLPWDGARPVHSFGSQIVIVTPPVEPPVSNVQLILRCPVPTDPADALRLIFSFDPCPGPPTPARRVYIVLHDVVVVRLPERTPIRASTLRISLDVDAWAWGIEATLLGRDALDLVVPGSDGSPVHIEVVIDGYAWRFIVEAWREARRFGERAVSISGRSEVALLSEPHVLPASYLSSGEMMAQQIAAAMLPVGYSLDWSAPDWLVPSGAYSHTTRTPAQAMAAIAAAAGLAAVPQRSGYGWTVRKIYETLPWQLDGAVPDRSVAASQIVGLTRALSLGDRGRANAVIVHGAETGGILATVRLLGSAGDRLAATYSDPLITAVEAARAAGERILAREYMQPPIDALELPLSHAGGDFPLAELGDLLHLDLGADAGLAVATGISVAASITDREVSVRQEIRLGESARNVALEFAGVTAGHPVTPGEVIAVHGDGTASVLLATGGTVRASSGGLAISPGARVYVSGGSITGPAPTFPSYVIEV